MSWEIMRFQRDVYFVSHSLLFGEGAVAALSLGTGTPGSGVVGLSSCREIAEQVCQCPGPPSLVPLTPVWFIGAFLSTGLHRWLDPSIAGLRAPCWLQSVRDRCLEEMVPSLSV